MTNTEPKPEYVIAYVTKYAITQGIMKLQGEIFGDRFHPRGYVDSIAPREWTMDKQQAIAMGEGIRRRELAKAIRRVHRLESLTIHIQEGISNTPKTFDNSLKSDTL